MQDIGAISTHAFTIPQLGIQLTVNPVTLITSWAIMGFLGVVLCPVAFRLRRFPGKLQAGCELFYTAFSDMAYEAMGKDAKKFIPLVVTIFLFVLVANWASVIPGVHSPTKDLNTCLGLGILVFIVAHVSAIMKKGLKA